MKSLMHKLSPKAAAFINSAKMNKLVGMPQAVSCLSPTTPAAAEGK